MVWIKDIELVGYSHETTIRMLIYTSMVLFFGQLLLSIHNVYFYLIKQEKYKAWPLSCFYALIFLG